MLFLYVDRMYLSDLVTLINRKDKRPVRTWCKKNNVPIFKDCSGEFVYRNDFELANDLPLILHLKSKYGNDWEQYYQAYLQNALYKIIDFKSDSKKQTGYVPKGSISRKIFNDDINESA
ncbi:MAG: hypothetical protein ACOYLP_10720 [Flavobacterium sp.]|uniref:hypothetical protein n=1 Tax=Flavobacterium sp. TaxID=239 RepID=UPI003BCD1B2A